MLDLALRALVRAVAIAELAVPDRAGIGAVSCKVVPCLHPNCAGNVGGGDVGGGHIIVILPIAALRGRAVDRLVRRLVAAADLVVGILSTTISLASCEECNPDGILLAYRVVAPDPMGFTRDVRAVAPWERAIVASGGGGRPVPVVKSLLVRRSPGRGVGAADGLRGVFAARIAFPR